MTQPTNNAIADADFKLLFPAHACYSGPYQNETGSDGIGDISHILEESNIDRYPLIYPYGYVPSPDVNDDEIVDIFDVVTVAEAFGSIPGDRACAHKRFKTQGKHVIEDSFTNY